MEGAPVPRGLRCDGKAASFDEGCQRSGSLQAALCIHGDCLNSLHQHQISAGGAQTKGHHEGQWPSSREAARHAKPCMQQDLASRSPSSLQQVSMIQPGVCTASA